MRLQVAGTGPLVIKIAGLVGGVGIFDEEIDAARRAGFRVAALDTTGDRSDDPSHVTITWDGLGAELLEAIDRLGAPAVLWGTSFGALVCLAAASRRPSAVRGLLLCFPPEPGWDRGTWRAVLRACRRGPRPVRRTARVFQTAFVALTGWEMLLPSGLVRLRRTHAAALDAATPWRTIADKLDLLLCAPALPLPSNGLPVSIIAAGLDTVTPVTGARRLAARIPGSHLRVIRLAGHAATFSRPRTYTRWALDELRRLSQAQPERRPV
jgi:pimeloyl-ACP methyl ester carboxylesterase